MSRPLRVEFPGALYLVTARVLPRNKLYRDAAEARDFVTRLASLYEGFGVFCHSYCVLPNHYHLLLETPRPNLARALHRLNAGYTATTNARRRRKGPLLQSRYRSLLLDEDPWLLRLSVHLHLNPVRRKLCKHPSEYRWSSAAVFSGADSPGGWLVTGRVQRLAGGAAAYRRYLDEAVRRPPESPWPHVWRQTVLGGDELRSRVAAVAGKRELREIPGFARVEHAGPTLGAVVAAVAEYTGVPPESVYRGKFQRVLARKLALYLARRWTDLPLREIGAAFGIDYTTVHMAARRAEELRNKDPVVDEMLTEIEAALQHGSEDTEGGAPDLAPRGGSGAGEARSSDPALPLSGAAVTRPPGGETEIAEREAEAPRKSPPRSRGKRGTKRRIEQLKLL